MLDKIDLQRVVTATVGALILSTACLVGAVGPVRAAEPPSAVAFVVPVPLAS